MWCSTIARRRGAVAGRVCARRRESRRSGADGAAAGVCTHIVLRTTKKRRRAPMLSIPAESRAEEGSRGRACGRRSRFGGLDFGWMFRGRAGRDGAALVAVVRTKPTACRRARRLDERLDAPTTSSSGTRCAAGRLGHLHALPYSRIFHHVPKLSPSEVSRSGCRSARRGLSAARRTRRRRTWRRSNSRRSPSRRPSPR